MIVPLQEHRPFPRLCFEFGFDDREEYEAELRGWRSHVAIEFDTGETFPLFFYDPGTLSQELGAAKSGISPALQSRGWSSLRRLPWKT